MTKTQCINIFLMKLNPLTNKRQDLIKDKKKKERKERGKIFKRNFSIKFVDN